MSVSFRFLLVLGLFRVYYCDVELRILKNVDNRYTPVSGTLQVLPGENFTLSCEVHSSVQDNNILDEEISWGKSQPGFFFKNDLDLKKAASSNTHIKSTFAHLFKQTDLHKSVLTFNPLKSSDEGTYFCMNLKNFLFKVVNIAIKDKDKSGFGANYVSPFGKSISSFYCTGEMFRCASNGVCIKRHFVCDGKKDCRDGSDEQHDTCNGDPCKDKLQCDDGRCIPTSWCCDITIDLNCTVTYRPPCCQSLSDSYDDLEYPSPNTHFRQGLSTQSLFILLCTLATFFSIILMLLILSKVFIFAKKTRCVRARNLLYLQDLTIRPARHDLVNCNPRSFDHYRNMGVMTRPGGGSHQHGVENGAGDPLLVISGNRRVCNGYVDQPPAYSDVVGETRPSVICEPPPPYTSRECLNEEVHGNI